MINPLNKKEINGKTIYKVCRIIAGRSYNNEYHIPSTVYVRVYTDCQIKCSYKPNEDGVGPLSCDFYGVDEEGERVYIMGFNGNIHVDKVSNLMEELFTSKEEANAKREEILNEIEKDINKYIDSTKDIIKASKAILESARKNNPLVNEKELLELATSAAE